MCGIAGIINFNNTTVKERDLLGMMGKMKHRGPDDEGLFIEDIVGLGFVRLSILDLSPAGHQPMFSPDKRYVLVFNGEIFNYIELREELKANGHSFNTNTDTEVLLASWVQWGEDCLHHFNGMWAFVIYDRENKKIFASRDRYGIKPFYYYLTEDFFAFASEIPPLLSLIPGKPTPNKQVIFDYLVFNRTDQTEKTFFSEIDKLQHGHCFSWNFKPSTIPLKPTIRKWYDLKDQVLKARNSNKICGFKELFITAVGLRLRSDVPVGVCLSGGLDSSAIVSVLLKEYQKQDLSTFSAVYNNGQVGDETAFIKLYDTELKNMFYTTPDASSLLNDIDFFIGMHAEPIPSTGPYAQYKVMELAKNNVVVTLDGQGADEMLAGYHYFFGFYFKELLYRGKVGLLLKEIFQYFKIHKSIYGLKTFAYFLLPKKFRTQGRINEKAYLKNDFVKNTKEIILFLGISIKQETCMMLL